MKDATYQREMLSEVKTLTYRLEIGNGFWCALWFWPLDKAAELPDREL